MTSEAWQEEKEELLVALESARNYLTGMSFDPRLHPEIKNAALQKAQEIDTLVAKFLE